MRVAIMQPYLFPYGGYWRLLTECDTFVVFDCVQFPRRGRVHRCEIAPQTWLTLPLAPAPRAALIRDMTFANNAPALMARQVSRLPWATPRDTALRREVLGLLEAPTGNLVDLLETGLRLVAQALGARATILRSSSLGVSPDLRRQDRVIEIARRLGATHYLNAPGGRALYDAESFARHGLTLEFLPDYTGDIPSMLRALFERPIDEIAHDIRQSAPGDGMAAEP